MPARICPHCKTELPAPEVAAHSDNMECPKCGAHLEVTSGARTIASLCGLVAGAIAWRIASRSSGDLNSVAPTLYAFLAFGVVSPLVLMITANLRNAALTPIFEAAHDTGHASHDAGGPGGGHH